MKHSILLVSLFLLAFAYGCKSSSTSTPAPPVVVIPNAGTTWTLQSIHLDSAGKTVRTDTSTRLVFKTNMQYQGFSDVVMTIETHSSTNTSDTVYLRYLSNGDISRLSSPAIDPQIPEWFTVPYTTHTAQSFDYGGNITARGFTHDTVTFTASFVRDENDTAASVVYPSSVITSTTWQKASSATKDSTDLITQTNSFIPSKGIFGNRNVTVNTVNGKQVQRVQQTLIGVSLK